MELVYLWIEDYKNIKKQGFNFSPKFHCEYNEKTKELTIEENNDYIPDFFGKNINTTAIVGKNGSGKSSVLEYLSDNKSIIYFFDKNQITKVQNSKKINIFLVDFNKECEYDSIFEIYNLFTNKEYINNFQETFNPTHLRFIFNLDLKFETLLYYLYNDEMAYIVFDEYIQDLDIEDLINGENIKKLENEFKQNYEKSIENILNENDFSSYLYLKYFYLKVLEYNSDLNNLYSYSFAEEENEYEDEITEIGVYIKLLLNFMGRNFYVEDYIREIKEIVNKYNNNIEKYIFNLNSLLTKNIKFDEKNQMYYVELRSLKKEVLKEITKSDLNYLLEIDFLRVLNDTKISFSNLSKGEQDFLKLFAEINYYIKEEYYNIILLDEIMVYWHPLWQKVFISKLLKFYEKVISNYNVHIIITSHSPFLLSDIPKQNIIFLDKDENGNCKVVNGLKEKKQTFGANIHTLLSDSFFMEDGLMGEFAKSKIDKVIRLLNKDNLSKEDIKYCEQIISIIGESIIKNQLQRVLDSKRLKKIDEIEALKESIVAMQKRLDELEK